MKNENNYIGTWVMIKDGNTYCDPSLIEFGENKIKHFELLEKTENGFLKRKLVLTENVSDIEHEFVSENRIRVFRVGQFVKVVNETETISGEKIFEIDYERLSPTKTDLSELEIINMSYEALWNEEKILIDFNKELDSESIRKINQRLKKEGRKLKLEILDKTYFATFYFNGNRDLLVPVREIDRDKIILYGFPKEPFEIEGARIK